MNAMTATGADIYLLRRKIGFTVAEFAVALNLHRYVVWGMESGRDPVPEATWRAALGLYALCRSLRGVA